jgi:hypothetical protein
MRDAGRQIWPERLARRCLASSWTALVSRASAMGVYLQRHLAAGHVARAPGRSPQSDPGRKQGVDVTPRSSGARQRGHRERKRTNEA